MDDHQKAACAVVEGITNNWASSYARAVELKPGAEKTRKLEFVALFSKPSKEETIAWPIVRVNFTWDSAFCLLFPLATPPSEFRCPCCSTILQGPLKSGLEEGLTVV